MTAKNIYSVVLFALLSCSSLTAKSSETDDQALATEYLRKNGLDAMVDLQTRELQRDLPLQSSELEQIVGVIYLARNRIQSFRHVTARDWRQIASKISKLSIQQVEQYLPDMLQQQTVNGACSVSFTKLLLDRGLTIKHSYYEADGSFLFNTVVSKAHCLPASEGDA